jgi:hypothetical protein
MNKLEAFAIIVVCVTETLIVLLFISVTLFCFLPSFHTHLFEHCKFLYSSYKMTNKVQLCRIIYYSLVPWLLYMFRKILSLIIRSI